MKGVGIRMLKLKITRVDDETVGVTVHGDVVTPAKPDAGEIVIRIVDAEWRHYFEIGKTYLPVLVEA